MKVFKVTLTTSTDLYIDCDTVQKAEEAVKRDYSQDLMGVDEYRLVTFGITLPDNHTKTVVKI
jgi:hypothetical protein